MTSQSFAGAVTARFSVARRRMDTWSCCVIAKSMIRTSANASFPRCLCVFEVPEQGRTCGHLLMADDAMVTAESERCRSNAAKGAARSKRSERDMDGRLEIAIQRYHSTRSLRILSFSEKRCSRSSAVGGSLPKATRSPRLTYWNISVKGDVSCNCPGGLERVHVG